MKSIDMSARIGLITLGVADAAKATSFYEQLGFVRSKTASQTAISVFKAASWSSRCSTGMLSRTVARQETSGPAIAARLRRICQAKLRSTP